MFSSEASDGVNSMALSVNFIIVNNRQSNENRSESNRSTFPETIIESNRIESPPVRNRIESNRIHPVQIIERNRFTPLESK